MNRFCRAALTVTASLTLSALIAACGDSSSNTTPQVGITSVKVMGDSLADVGTFGIKFTIQGNDTYPERISQLYGLPKGCPFFVFTGTTFAANPTAGCGNFAIGGGVINAASGEFVAMDPRVIANQFATANLAGNFGPKDLLIIDGGGNDASALVTAYLRTATDGGAAYLGLLGTVLTPAQLGAVQTACAGGATPACQGALAGAGNTYMTSLANNFYDTIQTKALDKGAQHIVLLNMPGITNTPLFQGVLNQVQAAAGAAARAQTEALVKSWVVSFNSQLASRAAGNAKIALVDFYTAFNDQIASPAQFGLTNVTTPACADKGSVAATWGSCTDAFLAANVPAGATGGSDWYDTWAFADGFHPSAYGHQLVSQLISRSLAVAGWL
jgi:phospholipase/lecithinase/hemolysin